MVIEWVFVYGVGLFGFGLSAPFIFIVAVDLRWDERHPRIVLSIHIRICTRILFGFRVYDFRLV